MKISVAMAAYNGAPFIEEQLDSIRLQKLHADEVIVVDDRSPDNTLEVLKNYRHKYPDFPLQIFQNEKNLGYRKNFREAVSHCTGD